MSPTPDPARLAGQQVLVLGLGAFGGGAGCVRALLRLGARVTVTDLRPAERLGEALDELAGLEVETVLGGHPPELFQGQVVVVNPAVPPGAPVLRLARERGCLLTTQVNLAARLLGRRSCAVVTGTHGKSTCAALAAHLLAEDPRRPVVLGGNLGGSLLLQALEAPPDARFVLELSSFQLERLEAPHGWPECVVLTSLSEDHLDRHGDPAAYWAAKRRAVAFQDAAGSLCLPAALPAARIAPWQKEAPGRILWLGATELPTDREGWFLAGDRIRERRGGDERELAPAAAAPFREPYRLPSLLGAIAAARLLGAPAAAVADRLGSWPGLPHRMEDLPAPPGLRLIDNGVATHPEATAAALRSLPEGTVLCAGGSDKGLDLSDLAAACRRCREVHLSGPGGRRLAGLLRNLEIPHRLHPNARTAMAAALQAARRGAPALLFSPSFASFDEFRNFRDRAAVFRELCADLAVGQEGTDRKVPGDRGAGTY